MRTNNMKIETLIVRLVRGSASPALLLLLLGFLLLASFSSPGFSQDTQPRRTFASPGEATTALFEATKKGDERALESILGAGKEVTSSGDDDEDRLEREQFSRKYQEMHRLVQEPDGSTVLYIGAENWPFPIPLASKNGAWYFDSDSGKREILFRRVGENETTAMEVCEEFAIAKNAAATKAASQDPITQFAESLATDASRPDNSSRLFHGYYFRIVTDNMTSDVSNGGKMKHRLTLVAYPAEYQSSGVKTFVVTRKGLVFEKDLGTDTKTLAPQMKARTGSSWRSAVSS